MAQIQHTMSSQLTCNDLCSETQRKTSGPIVWLHGLGDNGSSSSYLLESLPLANIKRICPTAPTRPVTLLWGFPCTAWFDVGEPLEDVSNDWEALDASAAHIANLLSTEPADGGPHLESGSC
nr:acyl-protein thioesterase 1 [Quercus suber]